MTTSLLAGMTTIVASVPAWTLWAVVPGLVGLAYGGSGPGSFAVDTGLGVIPLGDLTLPAALALFGGQVGRALAALAKWTPRIVVEHRHVQCDEESPTSP